MAAGIQRLGCPYLGWIPAVAQGLTHGPVTAACRGCTRGFAGLAEDPAGPQSLTVSWKGLASLGVGIKWISG